MFSPGKHLSTWLLTGCSIEIPIRVFVNFFKQNVCALIVTGNNDSSEAKGTHWFLFIFVSLLYCVGFHYKAHFAVFFISLNFLFNNMNCINSNNLRELLYRRVLNFQKSDVFCLVFMKNPGIFLKNFFSIIV